MSINLNCVAFQGIITGDNPRLTEARKLIDEINQQTPDQPKCRVVGLLKNKVVLLTDGAESETTPSFKTLRQWHRYATNRKPLPRKDNKSKP